MTPQNVKLKVIETTWLTTKITKVIMEVIEPSDFSFISGQHISIIIGDKESRPYSIASSMHDPKLLTFVVSVGHEGLGANYMKSLKVDDEVKAFGPLGRKLLLREPLKQNLVFCATGTGIAPMYSLLDQLAFLNCKSKIKLYFGVGTKQDIFFEEELSKLKESLPSFEYYICLSREESIDYPYKGYITKFISIDDPKNTQVYVCGLKPMVAQVRPMLLDQGVSEEDIIS